LNRKYTNRKYLDALQEHVLILDGATGTNIDRMNLSVEDYGGENFVGCNDYLSIVSPHAVEALHRSFLEVGVDVIETDTFRANRLTMSEFGLRDLVTAMNHKAADIARRMADEYTESTGQPRFVAGSIGPSGQLPSINDPELSRLSFDELVDIFYEQALALVQGGVDFILIETSQDIIETRAIILAAQKAFDTSGIYLPIQAQITLDTSGRMLLGTNIEAALTILEDLPIDVLGLNCSTGPTHMRQPIQFLGEHASKWVSCIPNAGLPINKDGKAVYPLEPEPFADALTEFVEKFNVSVVGGCCGSTPEHLSALVKRIHGRPQAPRPERTVNKLASGIHAVNMTQEPPPLLIGERLNTQGSRKFKKIIMEEDMSAVLDLARYQVESGAHTLDICVALTETDNEKEIMTKVIKTLAPVIDAPLVIDTTEPDVLETALKTAPGRCLINSINLEAGRDKADLILTLAKKYNAALIALTIDENGMAKTAERKLEVARRIHDMAVDEYGFQSADLVFDVLTFTLATGEKEYLDSAKATLDGIRLVKENLPGALTSLGVSNISFGLKPAARHMLNSVFLYHAVQAGLDMAIVNAATVKPYAEIAPADRALMEDLIFNNHSDALAKVIERFEGVQKIDKDKALAARQETLAKLSPRERLHWSILHRHKDDVEKTIDAILQDYPETERHDAAVQMLNSVLLPAMKDVGDRFGRGELILPFVLQSAEVMKRCVTRVETYLEKKAGTSKGTIVLATVYGDVHDIGKNLVKTILVNNGYEVVDLGKQVPVETIIAEAKNRQATAIGLSALLVSTSQQMPRVINELHRRSMDIPVLIGGAAINRQFGLRIANTEDGSPYQPGVFYCKDAFEGLDTLDALNDPERKGALQAKKAKEQAVGPRRVSQNNRPSVAPAIVSPSEFIPQAPFWGAKALMDIPLDEVIPLVNKKSLFRLSWGSKDANKADRPELEAGLEQRLKAMTKDAQKNGWLKPRAVYGFWPTQTDGDELIVYAPFTDNGAKPQELKRFSMPRQTTDRGLCLSDYFATKKSGVFDTVAFQVVTVGHAATERIEALHAAGQYSEAYFTHGLAVQTAEGIAEWVHARLRKEWGIPEKQGLRYSWGYPAIPDIADHRKVFDLLPAEEWLGMQLTSAGQMVPEQSTAAIVVHHPEARYFTIRK
jgi:5-methyltetrahydrofolate--homocysteine methyltransferase